MLLCKYCQQECKNENSLRNHERLCKENPNKQMHPRGNLGKVGWNKGLTAENDARVFKNTESLKRQRSINGSNWLGKTHSEATKNLMSIKACTRLQKNSKYSKNIEYIPGVILESTYEVRTAEILDALNIKWIKVRTGYIWNDDGKQRRYIPDFYLPEYDLFLDPKNDYLIEKDKRKINSAMEINSITVIVLSDNQISKEYIKSILPPVAQGEQVVL